MATLPPPPPPPTKQNKTTKNKTKTKTNQKKTVDIIKTLIAVSSHSKHFISSRSLSDVSSHWDETTYFS